MKGGLLEVLHARGRPPRLQVEVFWVSIPAGFGIVPLDKHT